ncbi:MAG: hypothetical protein ABEJ76_04870 [Halanaeroarchaeum sp.]
MRGRAIDLRERRVDPAALAAAIGTGEGTVVTTPPPTPMHDYVGHLAPGRHVPLRPALAAAARSRGRRSPHADALAAIDARLEDLRADTVDLAPYRRRAAEAGSDVEALRERVATLRGRIEARRDAGRSTGEAEAALREAAATLSEVETDRLAARQALAAAEREARSARDARDRRLRLVDRRDNLERRARRWLAAREYPRFARALAALPMAADAGSEPADFGGSGFQAGLAVARIAALRAPVVLVDGPFETATEARAALDAAVVLV